MNIYLTLFKNWEEIDVGSCDNFKKLLRVMNLVFSYAIPTDEAITEILNYSPIVEMFAGSGYWAWVLKNKGCNIELYDNHSFSIKQNEYYPALCPNPYYWIKPKTATPDILKENRFHNYTLFLCWPPDENIGKEAAECLKFYTGNKLIYIGQKENGKTGGKIFFNKLKKEWSPNKIIKLPSWSNFYSCELYIYNKKT